MWPDPRRDQVEPGGARGLAGDGAARGSEHYVYVESLRLRPCEIHLSLLGTGAPEAAQLVRQHAGPFTQRMLAKVRLDDVKVCAMTRHASPRTPPDRRPPLVSCSVSVRKVD